MSEGMVITMKPETKKQLITAAEAAGVFVITFAICFFDVFYSLNSLLVDKLYQQPRTINNKIKIIAIDNKSIEQLGAFGTWSRSDYAKIINTLGDYPSVIAFDIMTFDDMDEAGDSEFIEACKNNGKVVSGSYVNFEKQLVYDQNGKAYIDNMHINSVSMPINSDCTVTGYVNSSPDSDGIVRSIVPEVEFDGKKISSFAYEIYKLYCKEMNIETKVPKLDSTGKMWINYAGRPGDYEYISLVDVLNGEPNANPKIFKDCIVIIGAYSNGLQDQFSVSNSAEQMFGVEIHANIVQALIDGRSPVPAPQLLYALAAGLLAALSFVLMSRFKVKTGAIFTFGLIAAYIALGIICYGKGLSMPIIYVPLVLFMSFLVTFGGHYINEIIEKRKITSAFRKYVAPQVVDEIAKSGQYHIKLGGENRDIAVLFVDIRGFTTMSENLEPEQVVDILNTYFNLTTRAIFNNSGTLDKFIGDATMAVFNAPFDLEDYVYKAVCAAWEIVEGAAEIESSCIEKYGKSVGFGVGVNCGPAVVGNIGCDWRMDYTAIGDTVNTASRLESNAKRGQVLISENVYNRVKDRVTVEDIGEIPLKGKSKGVFVYKLTGIGGEAPAGSITIK